MEGLGAPVSIRLISILQVIELSMPSTDVYARSERASFAAEIIQVSGRMESNKWKFKYMGKC